MTVSKKRKYEIAVILLNHILGGPEGFNLLDNIVEREEELAEAARDLGVGVNELRALLEEIREHGTKAIAEGRTRTRRGVDHE